MTENRKRPRENVISKHNGTIKTNSPPTKKRRIQTKQSKKTFNKDMSKWSIDELKKYLNENAITFQMNKNKSYYYRLAKMHKIVQDNKANDKKQKSKHAKSSFDAFNNHKMEKESPPVPLFSTPKRKATPPLPVSLSRKPLTSDTFSEEGVEEETPPITSQAIETITPNSSRPLINTTTPSRQINTKSPSLLNDNASAAIPTNMNTFPSQPNPPSTEEKCIMREERRIPQETMIGPFQDISMPKLRIPRIPIPRIQISKFPKISRGEISNSYNKFLMLMCSIVILAMSMSIPSLFMATPYCDNNNDKILGSYYYLESIMKCKTCPYKALKCENGMVECAHNGHLDTYGVICLENDNENANIASQIAYKTHEILGTRLGDWYCNNESDSIIYELNEEDLKTEIKFLKEIDDENGFNEGWDMAIKEIIPNAYKETVIYNNDTRKYKSFRPISLSYYCKVLWLKTQYLDNKDVKLEFIWAIIVFVIVILIVVVAFRGRMKEIDEDAMKAANFVLLKLSQQPALHFSIHQFKHYTMRTQNIDINIWEKTLKYINQSSFVEPVPEDVDGQVRMCWKWKGRVPFVPIN